MTISNEDNKYPGGKAFGNTVLKSYNQPRVLLKQTTTVGARKVMDSLLPDDEKRHLVSTVASWMRHTPKAGSYLKHLYIWFFIKFCKDFLTHVHPPTFIILLVSYILQCSFYALQELKKKAR